MNKLLFAGLIATAALLGSGCYTSRSAQKAKAEGKAEAKEIPGHAFVPLTAEVPPPAAEPKVTDPGPPPSDAIILFDGKDLSQWKAEKSGEAKWKVLDGYMEVNGTGSIATKQEFGDCQLHVEWATPVEVKGEGQGRGNSGVFLQSRYELQVLDSHNNKTYFHGQAGSIYKEYAPLVNASRKP